MGLAVGGSEDREVLSKGFHALRGLAEALGEPKAVPASCESLGRRGRVDAANRHTTHAVLSSLGSVYGRCEVALPVASFVIRRGYPRLRCNVHEKDEASLEGYMTAKAWYRRLIESLVDGWERDCREWSGLCRVSLDASGCGGFPGKVAARVSADSVDHGTVKRRG